MITLVNLKMKLLKQLKMSKEQLKMSKDWNYRKVTKLNTFEQEKKNQIRSKTSKSFWSKEINENE